MDQTDLQADCLLAVTGILPDEITAKEREVAAALPDRWGKRLKTWLGAAPKPFPYVEPRNMDRLFDKVAVEPVQTDVDALLGPILVEDPELGAAYFRGLVAARQYLVAVWPRVVVDGMAGPKVQPLSTDDTAEIWSLFQVLDDPDRVLDELDAGTLTSTQADALRACFPALAAEADRLLDVAIADRMARNRSWEPGWRQETLLRTLRGLPPEVPFVPPPAPPKDTTKFELNVDGARTQADVSSEPKGAAAPK